jgi:hypothetical protein
LLALVNAADIAKEGGTPMIPADPHLLRHRRRVARTGLLPATTLAVLMALSGTALAGGGNPSFTVVLATPAAVYPGPDATNSVSVFLTGSGGSGVATSTYNIANGESALDIAESIDNVLSTNPLIAPAFTIAVDPESVNVPVGFPRSTIYPGYVVTLTAIDPSVTRSFGAARTTGKGSLFPLRVYVAVDPTEGQADFELIGTPDGDGEVTIGIDGMEVTTNTYSTPGVPLTDDQIMETLDGELAADGITDASIDLSTDDLTELDVSTGDPIGTDGADDGAFVDTTDTGLTTYAAVFIPEPSSLTLLATGSLAGLLWRRRRRHKGEL